MTATDFDPVWATTLARASAAAYSDSVDSIHRELPSDAVEIFSCGPASGYVAGVGDDVIVAFRGTVSPIAEWEHSIRQWIANLDFHQIPVHGGRVHRGFHQALDGVWDAVRMMVKNRTGAKSRLWVTGHSLGGALAILAGIRLHEEAVTVSGVYTFGAPGVGDAAFGSAYQPPVHRIENSCDVVCHLPPSSTITGLASKVFGPVVVPENAQYESVGKLTVLNESGKFQTVNSPAEHGNVSRLRLLEMLITAGTDLARFLADHKINAYVSRLAHASNGASPWFIEIPGHLLTILRKLRRSGPALRDTTGRIVGFLQETGLLQKTIDNSAVRGILQDATDIARDGRADQVLSALSTLRLLNGATLAATLVLAAL